MYWFTDNYIYEYGTDLYGENTVSPYYEYFIMDGDKNTYWESSKTNPVLTINLANSHRIDSLWIKAQNISDFDLYYYTNTWNLVDATPENKDNNIWFLFNFTPATAKAWQIRFTSTGNVKVYELFLMESRLFQSNDIDLPSKIDIVYNDIASVEHTLANGQTVIYAGKRAYADINIEYQYTPKSNRDNLYLIYTLPYLRSPICILPDIDYPENIFRCIWIDKTFPLIYAISYKGAGFSGTIKLREC